MQRYPNKIPDPTIGILSNGAPIIQRDLDWAKQMMTEYAEKAARLERLAESAINAQSAGGYQSRARLLRKDEARWLETIKMYEAAVTQYQLSEKG